MNAERRVDALDRLCEGLAIRRGGLGDLPDLDTSSTSSRSCRFSTLGKFQWAAMPPGVGISRDFTMKSSCKDKFSAL